MTKSISDNAGKRSAPPAGSEYIVRADHPIFLRPDKRFTGKHAFNEALAFAKQLSNRGFENISVNALPNTSITGRSEQKERK